MNLTIEKFQQAQVRKDLPALRPGDTVRIHVRLKEAEGEKERDPVMPRGRNACSRVNRSFRPG